MSVKAITTIRGTAVPLGLDHVDTDQVIPARFLKGTTKEGFGQNLFYDLRFLADGSLNPDFVLNNPHYAHARFLIAGENFGCGSSREHAPWALTGYGFEVILAESFADIFRNNALKNGLLPIALPKQVITELLNLVRENPTLEMEVDLPEQVINLGSLGKHSFAIDAFWKKCLVQGLDQVGYTLSHLQAIEAFEKQHEAQWQYAASAVQR